MSYPNPNQHQYAQHYAAQQQAYAAQQQIPRQQNQRQPQQTPPHQQQQQQRAMQAGRGAAHPAAAAAAAAGRYGPGPAGMVPGYPPQALKASPRGRGTSVPNVTPKGAAGTAPGMPANSAIGASSATAAARGGSASMAEEPVDFEFLGLISDILRMVEPGEQGCAANADVVKDKVDELQAKFARAKAALEQMDGADLTPQMQEDMFEVYQNRLKHLNGMMATYSQLPIFDQTPS